MHLYKVEYFNVKKNDNTGNSNSNFNMEFVSLQLCYIS